MPTPVSEISFTVVPIEAPRLVRHCPRCGVDRPFLSSDRFRVNAQKRRLDVWLIRRCAACDGTWNQPVHERVTPGSLGARLDAYHADHPAVAHAVASDEATLRRHGRVEPATFRVDRPVASPPFVARIGFERPAAVRLDAVLCAGLGVSRSHLRRLVDAQLVLTPAPLDRAATEGSKVWVWPTPPPNR
ncbi:MAG: DUF1062 domain-containing protein [Myxococcota bacterium]